MMIETYARWQKNTVLHRLANYRVTLVKGARQCGKTTLVSTIGLPEMVYLTLDNHQIQQSAKADPISFLSRYEGKMVALDEIQKATDLISVIKMTVDKNHAPGQFLLTGSTELPSRPTIIDSLAGRVAPVRMRTLTVGEILRSQPLFFDLVKAKSWPTKFTYHDKKDIFDFALTGGYPEAQGKNSTDRLIWHTDYRDVLLERDLREIKNIRRMDKLKKLLTLLSAWSGKYLNKDSIASALKISNVTLDTYINALSALYLFDEVPAWSDTDYKRAGKLSKIYCTDTGFMASMLNFDFDPDKIMEYPEQSGKLIETFVYNQIAAMVDLYRPWEIFHYRDAKGREIDLIVKTPERVYGIEVKSGRTARIEDTKHLRWFRNNLKLDRPFLGLILYAGEDVLPFGDDIWALPIAALWST
jgi:predicted AAA+ superfamily ATPase